MSPTPLPSKAASPVLFLGPDRVAWLDRGSDVLHEHFADHDLVDPLDSITALFEAAKLKPRPCVVALGSSFVRSRQLELPVALSGRELTSVLTRRAAELVQDGADVVFAATPLAGRAQLARKALQAWRVHAVDADWLTELSAHLRKRRLDPQRVVVAELAGASAVDRSAPDAAAVLVSYLGDSVSIALVVDAGLVDTLSIPTAGLDDAGLASSLVQELRNLETTWRRQSEGSDLARVEFLGFGSRWRDRFEPAARMTLQDVELHFHAHAAHAEEASLAALLSCASQADPLLPELGVRLPYTKLRVGALVTACALLVGWGGTQAASFVSAWVTQLEADLAERRVVTEQLEELRNEVAHAERKRGDLAAEWTALTGTSGLDLPLRTLMSDAIAATDDHSAIETLEFSAETGTVEFRMTAATLGATQFASDGMRRTLATYRDQGTYADLALEPEAKVPDGSSDQAGGPGLARYTLMGTWRETR